MIVRGRRGWWDGKVNRYLKRFHFSTETRASVCTNTHILHWMAAFLSLIPNFLPDYYLDYLFNFILFHLDYLFFPNQAKLQYLLWNKNKCPTALWLFILVCIEFCGCVGVFRLLVFSIYIFYIKKQLKMSGATAAPTRSPTSQTAFRAAALFLCCLWSPQIG